MQTFLPYADFTKTAQCLDMRRLGKQRSEVIQLLNALLIPGKGWGNHPAAKMWKGYEECLRVYGLSICQEWIMRGYKDTCLQKIHKFSPPVVVGNLCPPWLGHKAFHDSHKSNLLRKDPVFYGKYKWNVPDDLPYVWPITE